MAGTIGSNTLSVSSSGYGSGSYTYQLLINENSYDATARTANITVTFQLKGVKSYYSSWSDSDATLSITTNNGGSGSTSLNATHSTNKSSYTTVGSYTGTFTYKDDGSLTINASATFGWSSSDGSYLPLSSTITASGDCTNIGEATVDPDLVETEFSSIKAMQSFTTPYPGTYTLECWGARGAGSYSQSNTVVGGGGGYAKGSYLTTKNKTLYIGCGGAPWTDSGDYTSGGWNGGGSGSSQYYRKGGGGGGATHIALENNILRNCTPSNVLIVAGGGGGGGDISAARGGNGGGETGLHADGAYGAGGYPYGGRAGTQTATGDQNLMVDMDSDVSGGFGYGGPGEVMSSSSYYGGGGGGAGWYGGTGGASYTNSKAGGGGGGSGHVSSSLTDTSMSNTTNHRDSGKVKISYLHKILSYYANGGTTTPDSQDFAAPSPLTTAASISRPDETAVEQKEISVNTSGGNPINELSTDMFYNVSYSFKNWSDGSNEYQAESEDIFSKNITLSAQWVEQQNNINYTNIQIPIPTKDDSTEVLQEQVELILDANGGSW